MAYLRHTIAFFCLCLLVSCAQQRMPTGGEKDEAPPVVVDATPAPLSTGVSSQEIEITFDEYIQLQEVRDQVLISPPLDKPPTIEVRGGKRVHIDFGEEILRDNTTYTINFGEAIKDYNEGNILTENVYLFSTGDYIDTLLIQGRLLRARYGGPCDGCLALLYADVHDSLVLGERPYYVGRADATGAFRIDNLSPGSYRLLAVDDLDADLRIDPNEARAFSDASVIPAAMDSSTHVLRLFSPLDERQEVKDYAWSEDGRNLLVVTRGLDDVPEIQLDLQDRLLYVERLGGKEDSLRYWFDGALSEVNEIVLQHEVQSDTISVRRVKDTSPLKKLELQANLEHKDAPLELHLSRPLGSFIDDAILLTKDSVPVTWTVQDTVPSAMTLNVWADWEEGAYYDIIVPSGAIEDMYGFSHDSLIMRIRCPEEKTFGTLTLSVDLSAYDANGFLEVLDKKNQVTHSNQVDSTLRWTLPHLPPGEYSLRVFLDQNEDGEWTTGALESRTQPEPVFVLEQPITVRANWELEQEIIVEFE